MDIAMGISEGLARNVLSASVNGEVWDANRSITSDSTLTIMHNLPMDGFVVVSTPQDLANLDAKRCINMIRKLNLNVLGVVENYTGEIFGEGGGKNLAKEVDAPFLGDIALRSIYRDASKPTALLDKSVGKEFKSVADAMKKSLKEFGSEAV